MTTYSRYLVDTHTLLWALHEPEHLPEDVRAKIGAQSSLVFVSIGTLWEIAIKVSIGKLEVPPGFLDGVQSAGYEILPISLDHLKTYAALPLHHRDPFDRLIAAQALCDGVTLITHDEVLARYQAPILLY